MVSVRFFAGFREKVNTDRIDMPVESGMTLEGLLKRIDEEFPELGAVLNKGQATVAVNHEVVGWDYLLKNGDEVAIFPPVSGG